MIYINGTAQISVQKPMCTEWMHSPLRYGKKTLVKALDPDFKACLAPSSLRRMSLLQRRAAVCALAALKDAALEMPDAIFTATGAGTMKNTEDFLKSVKEGSGESLAPTSFINSTHNTLGSGIAMLLGCTGMNCTYSHNALSFESALLDAVMAIELAEVSNVLVSAHDEMPEQYFRLLDAAGAFVGEPFTGEHSFSFVLAKEKGPRAVAAVAGVEISMLQSSEELKERLSLLYSRSGISPQSEQRIVISGDPSLTRELLGVDCNFPYKDIFGGGFSASSAAFYASAELIASIGADHALIHNHYGNFQHSIVLLANTEIYA